MNKAHKKIPALTIARHVVQLAAFLAFPGLFLSVLTALRDIFTALFGGSFDASAHMPQLTLAGSALVVTAVMGRFFCGFLCSFGAMGDLLWYVGRKLKLPRLKVGEKADRLLKLLKYAVLLGIVGFVWTGLASVPSTWSPWTIFGMYASVRGWPSAAYLVSVGGLLLLAIMAGSLFVRRFFCRYLCPLGAIFAIISRFRLIRINKPSKQCGKCRACTAKCAMGIPLYRGDAVTSGECIDCFECVEVCPRSNVSANPAPAVATVIAVGALTGFYYAGTLSTEATSESLQTATVAETATSTDQTATATGQYADGVYTGSASGYRGTTQVSVTVENGLIADIEILSCGDDQEFMSKARSTVIASILAAQNTDVDAVSGATFSSNGIIGAVADALSAAGGTDAAEAEETLSSEILPDEETAEPAATAAGADLALADGVYTGSGTGFRGTTGVSVTVSGCEITEITVESYQDDTQYFSRAESAIIDEIIAAQSVDVDAVSGATFSSNGILEAVADALGLDFTNGNSANQGGHGAHGGGLNSRGN